jgi:type II secretion system protein C
MLLASLVAVAALASPPPDLAATGIVMSARAEARTAVLRAGDRTRVVGIGDTAFGGRVAEIEPGHVAVDFDSGRVTLRLLAAAPVLPAPAAAAVPLPGEDAPVLERRDVERRLGEESSRILAETTLVPAMDGGRVAGFTISRMPSGTVLSDAGLRAGDVLTEVNGVPIDSLATLVGLWPRLQAESALQAVVLRNGQPVTLSVALR